MVIDHDILTDFSGKAPQSDSVKVAAAHIAILFLKMDSLSDNTQDIIFNHCRSMGNSVINPTMCLRIRMASPTSGPLLPLTLARTKASGPYV